MTTRAKLFSQLARRVDTSGTITSDGISSTVSLGATVYDSIGELPTSGYSAGEQAFVKSTSRLYINSGVGWYNVAVINNTPTIQSVLDSDGGTTPFALAADGTATTITITAQDSDGDTLTYTAVTDSDFGGLATVSQADNVFTITPFSQDSATTESGTITFNVSDGINIANSLQTFTIEFISGLWSETVLSIGTSSTDGLDNSTFIDRSTNAQTVTTSGSPVQTAFHPYLDNWSVEFPDGANKYLSVAASNDFSFGTGDFTIECWYYHLPKTASDTDRRYLIHTEESWDGTRWILYTAFSDNKFSFYTYQDYIANGNTRMLSSTSDLVLNQWHHLALTRSGNTFRIFINGVLEDSSTRYTGSVGADTYPTYIGGGANQTNRMLSGMVSNARIIKGTALYTSAFTPPTAPLTEVNGTSLLCNFTNAGIYDGTGRNVLETVGDAHVENSAKKYGTGSMQFDGTGDYLFVQGLDNLEFGTGDFTVEFWLNTSNLDVVPFDCRPASTQGDYLTLYIDTNGALRWEEGGANRIISSNGAISTGTWYHIAATREGTNSKLFLDGTQVGSTYTDSTNYLIPSGRPSIGAQGRTVGNSGVNGYIDDLRITKGVARYTANFTPPAAKLPNL